MCFIYVRSHLLLIKLSIFIRMFSSGLNGIFTCRDGFLLFVIGSGSFSFDLFLFVFLCPFGTAERYHATVQSTR